MKITIYKPIWIQLLMSAILLVNISSCKKESNSSMMIPIIAEINDTLRAGNLTKAIEMTDALKRDALIKRDSALWSEAMVQQGVNSYYQGNAPLVLTSSDSAIMWLERQKPSKEIARLLAKAYQTHGAYYDQYYFNPDSSALYFRKAVDHAELSGIKEDLPQA